MRELKFRIWYYDQKKFDNNVELKDFKRYSFPLHWCCVQQYTGMKDKNGKEIYEGDVVKTVDGISKLDIEFAEYTHGEVKWLREGVEVCQEHVGATRLSVFSKCDCCPADLEIIGNIYETPELLTQ